MTLIENQKRKWVITTTKKGKVLQTRFEAKKSPYLKEQV